MSIQSRHQLIEKLGAGGFGTVYRALDTQLDREVAIKRLNMDADSTRVELNNHLLREAKILATLKHPNIVTIYDIQSEADSAEIIMELIEGITLDELIDKHPLLPEDFVYVAIQLLSALATAHEHNVLHCDLKPGNVMVRMVGEQSFEMKILDFGMSPALTETGSQSTSSSKVLGSIHFMAPEQFDNTPVSQATDIYSIGCLFYYMLTGFKPFAGDTSVQIMASHVTNNFQPITTVIPNFNPELAAWVETHFSKDPLQRHPSVRDSLNNLLKLIVTNPEDRTVIVSADYPGATRRPSSLRKQALSPLDHKSGIQVTKPHNSTEEANVLANVDSKLAAKLEKNFHQTKPDTLYKAKPPKSLAEEVIKVEPNSTWYFTVNDSRKGPVPLDKLCTLVELGHLPPNESVWHPSFREWQKITDTTELQEALTRSPSKPHIKTNTPPFLNQSTQTTRPKKIKSTDAQEYQEFVSCKFEVLLILLSSISIGMIIWQLPKLWQLTFITLGVFLIIISMIRTRVTMLKTNKPLLALSMITPIVSDVIYSFLRPNLALKNLATLLLGLALLAYSLLNRYPYDAFHLIGADQTLKDISQTLGSFLD